MDPMDAVEPVEHALKTKAAWLGSAPVNPSAMRMSVGQMDAMASAEPVMMGNPARKGPVYVFLIAAGTPAVRTAGVPAAIRNTYTGPFLAGFPIITGSADAIASI